MNAWSAQNYSLDVILDDSHAELVARYWLMCQDSDRRSVGLFKIEYWIIIILATAQ